MPVKARPAPRARTLAAICCTLPARWPPPPPTSRSRTALLAHPPAGGARTPWQISASYDFALVKLFGQYNRVKTNVARDTETKLTSVGASVPIGLGKVLLQYGNAHADFGVPEVTNKTLTLGYDYNLSKNTDVYAVWMHEKLTAKTAGNTVATGIRLRCLHAHAADPQRLPAGDERRPAA